MARLPQIDLAVAALDLQLVRLLRSAMQPKVRPVAAPVCPPRPAVVQRLQPDPAPLRQVPAAAKPLLVVYRTELKPVSIPSPHAPHPSAEPGKTPSAVLPPPWKQPVWELPIEPPPEIKIVIHRPDIITKGSLLDFFI